MCYVRAVPIPYSADRSLSLRVEPSTKSALESLEEMLSPRLRLSRNTIADLALAVGVEVLRGELARDPMALHARLARASAVSAPATTSTHTTNAPSPAEASVVSAPSPSRPTTPRRAPRAAPTGAPVAAALGELPPGVDRTSVLVRLLDGVTNGRVHLRAVARETGVSRSTLQRWADGAAVGDAVVAKVHAWLEQHATTAG